MLVTALATFPMPLARTVGALGTLVCDRIHGPPPERAFSSGWGGLAYSLSALSAALGEGWEAVPIIKVGADVIEAAQPWVLALPRMAAKAVLLSVDAPNNRSELRYVGLEGRTERMSGGVSGWAYDELAAVLAATQLDALYVNFLSGIELDLATMQRVRASFGGPIYADLHMMLWQTDASGRRSLRPLANAAQWCSCFDFIQVNEEEMTTIAADPDDLAALARQAGARATFVTLGSRGAHYHASELRLALSHGHPEGYRGTMEPSDSRVDGISPPYLVPADTLLDPTGCGDVWGATLFARMLAGDSLDSALEWASHAASLNAQSQGVADLANDLSRLRAARG